MSTPVEYVLSLRDELSSGLDKAGIHANKLEHSLKGVGEMLGVIGVSMVAFAGFEALKGAHESWEKMEFSISQVEAGLKSTQGAAGLTFEEIQDSAIKTAHNVKYASSEIMGMQSVLLTFPSITKQSFQPATDIILDMSTRLGTDLKSAAIQVGKALQDPEKGVSALRRVGVNFNETQLETIKHLTATNQLAKAQALILNELNLEFAGSANAAAAADAGFRYSKSLEEIRLEVGHLVDRLAADFMPVALKFLEWVKDGVDWIKRNASQIKQWTLAIGAAVVTFKTLEIVPPLLLAIENSLVAAATSASSFGVSMLAAINPVTAMAVAVGALVLAYQKLEQYQDNKTKYLNDVATDEEDFVAQGMKKYEGQKNARELAIKDEQADIDRRRKMYEEEMKKLDPENKGVTSLMYSTQKTNDYLAYTKELEILDAAQRGLDRVKKSDPSKPKNIAKPGGTGLAKTDTKTKATGSKSVTINVTIQKLGETHINTTNVKEGFVKLHDAVTAALTGAVNDFQIVAGE